MKKIACIFILVLLSSKSLMAAELEVKISKDPLNNSWLIEYTSSEEFKSIKFRDGIVPFIKNAWELNQDKLATLTDSRVTFASALKYYSINIKYPFNKTLTREYTPFLLFSDNTIAMYVDHYVPEEVDFISGTVTSVRNITRVIVKSNLGREIRYKQQVSNEILELGNNIDSKIDYVFFGKVNSKNREEYISLFDEALPGWIYKIVQAETIRYMRHYVAQIGKKLQRPPLIAINFTKNNEYPFIDGGYINGDVFINISGNGWFGQNRQNEITISSTIAHELAHAWQYSLTAEKEDPVWLKEGGADALAFKSMLDLSIISNKEYIQIINTAYSDCYNSLKWSTLDNLILNKKNRSNYSCGQIIQIGIASKKVPNDLFNMWRYLYLNENGENFLPLHTLNEYFKKDSQSIDILKIRGGLNSNSSSTRLSNYEDLLNNFTFEEPTKENINKDELLTATVEYILEAACPEMWSGFWDEDNYLRPDVSDKCKLLSTDYIFALVNNTSLLTDTYNAYISIIRNCKSDGFLTINKYGAQSSKRISCSENMPFHFSKKIKKI